MNFDQPKTPQIENKEAFDEKWYERFELVGNFEDFENLEGSKEERERQKRSFLNEEIRNPVLDYPKLESFDFEGREVGLLKLKKDILEKEKNEVVRNVYRWRINEKLAQLRMLRSSKNSKDRKFSRYSRFIYGNPEKDIFIESLSLVKDEIEKRKNSDDESVLLAIKRIEESLNLGSISDNSVEENAFKGFDAKGDLAESTEAGLSAEEIQERFSKALEEYEIDGWEVVVEKDITGISVSQEKKKVRIPESRKLSEMKLQGLIAHEIETHVLRRKNGERSRLKILGLGLDRYLKGEEGVSTYKEQKIIGMEDFAGFDGHFAIALAMGVDGKKRDFREVFNILRDYFFIKSKLKDRTKAWENAKTNAWNRCIRTFRGTSCNGKGFCLTRDIVYREGNIGVWNLVKNNPDEERRFSIGKYDPTNPRHIWILEQLGITDEDLEVLDSSLASDES